MGSESRARYVVLGWLCLAATIAYLHRQCFAVAATPIQSELGLSEDQLGWAMGAFYAAYAALQLPSGWFADRFGSRIALSLLAAGWSLALGFTSAATGVAVLVAGRFLCGGLQAGVFPCSVQTIARWFPLAERATANGFLTSFMSVGGVIASATAGLMLGWISWQATFLLFATPGLLWSCGFWYWFRDDPRDHPSVDPLELKRIHGRLGPPARQPAGPTPWRMILGSATMWLIALQQFFRAMGYVFYQTWFPTYLQETKHSSLAESGVLTSMPLLATVLGALAGGAATDWLQKRTNDLRFSRRVIAVSSLTTCAVLVFAASFVAHPVAGVATISAGAFFAALAGPASYAITIDLGGRRVATVFSLMNMGGNIGGTLCPILVPWIVRSSGSWDSALVFFTGVYAAAAVSWIFVDASRPIVSE